MAVRDDFAAGEVLAAADLNDTFASKLPYSYGTATPSTTDSGFLWYDSNSTPPDIKFWTGSAFRRLGGGIVAIGRFQGSTVSSLNINNVFSSSYTRYRIVVAVSSSDGLGYGIRLRASGSDDTNASYDQQVINANGATLTSSVAADATAWNIVCSPNRELHTFELLNPEAAATTQGHAFTGNSAGGAPQIRLRYLQHDDATAFDGLSFFAFTGGETISIVADIFAYNE